MSLPKYETVKELQDRIDEYFADPTLSEKPTVSGLALFLGFESRQSLYDYGKREKTSYTIKKAFLKIEERLEQRLYSGAPAGAIFALKQRGWRDDGTGAFGPKKVPEPEDSDVEVNYDELSESTLLELEKAGTKKDSNAKGR